MTPYLDLLREVLEQGEQRTDRTGTGTLSLFGTRTRYDLRDGFPLLTTKRMPFGLVAKELLWFLSGSTDVNDLDDVGAGHLWRPWARPNGELGPIYGHQWRNAGGTLRSTGVDQISEALKQIKETPDSRRIIVSAWNVRDLPAMRLPPCHVLFQFYVSGGKYLDLQLYQRSADLAIGVPFNVASYALLLSMFAMECGLTPRHFIHTIGDAHIYLNHIDGVKAQLTREPLPAPQLVLAPGNVLEQTLENISILDYASHPAIKFEVAV